MSPTKAKEVRPEKLEAVKEIKERFQRAKIAIFTDYQGQKGLPVTEVQKLRRKLLESKGELKVMKNSLAEKALESLKIEKLSTYFKHASAVAFGYDDPALTAKALFEFTKDTKKDKNDPGLPIIKGAWYGEAIIGPDQVRFLASLPPKPILLSQLLGTMNAPITGLVTVLSGTLRGLVTVLAQIRKQKESSAPPVKPAPVKEEAVSSAEPAPAKDSPVPTVEPELAQESGAASVEPTQPDEGVK